MFLLIDSFTKIELLLQGPALQLPGDLGGGLCRDNATFYEQNRHQMPPFYRQLKSDCFTRTNVELLLQGPALRFPCRHILRKKQARNDNIYRQLKIIFSSSIAVETRTGPKAKRCGILHKKQAPNANLCDQLLINCFPWLSPVQFQ